MILKKGISCILIFPLCTEDTNHDNTALRGAGCSVNGKKIKDAMLFLRGFKVVQISSLLKSFSPSRNVCHCLHTVRIFVNRQHEILSAASNTFCIRFRVNLVPDHYQCVFVLFFQEKTKRSKSFPKKEKTKSDF